MKRADLVRFLFKFGCILHREGAKHSVFFNPATGRFSTIPRHREINPFLAKQICEDLGVTKIKPH